MRVLWGSVLGSLYIRDHVGRWAVPSSPWALCLKAGPSDSQLAGGAPWTVAEGRTGPCRWTATSETTPSPVWAPGAVAQPGCPCGTPAPGAHTASRCRHVSTTDTSSASEDEGPGQRPGRPAAAAPQSRPGRGPRLSPGSSTSSSASSASSQPGGSLAGALAGPAALGHGGQYRPPRPCTGAPRASGPTGRLLGHRRLLLRLGSGRRRPVVCGLPQGCRGGRGVWRRAPRPAPGGRAGPGGRCGWTVTQTWLHSLLLGALGPQPRHCPHLWVRQLSLWLAGPGGAGTAAARPSPPASQVKQPSP